MNETGTGYVVYGELPDGDKKIIFTAQENFKCCNCCNECRVPFLFWSYFCCDKILFQMDYKRNNLPFYTQGINILKGCHCDCCCCLFCCIYCCLGQDLYLRENTEPDNPDFRVGIQKGRTTASVCDCCSDKTVSYTSQEGMRGPTVRLFCCDSIKKSCACCLCNCSDFNLPIEGTQGSGNILVPNGCYSTKNQQSCFCPSRYFEITFPPNTSSDEKFQIIADAIHLDISKMVL